MGTSYAKFFRITSINEFFEGYLRVLCTSDNFSFPILDIVDKLWFRILNRIIIDARFVLIDVQSFSNFFRIVGGFKKSVKGLMSFSNKF